MHSEVTSSTTPVSESDDFRTIGRTAAWLAKHVEVGLATVDLSLPQYRVLGLLHESSAFSSDLAERLAVRPPSVTSVVDGLVGRGLVERQYIEEDRRRVVLVLTKSGRQALDAGDSAVSSRLGEIIGCLDDTVETERAVGGLLVWRKAFGSYRRVMMARR